MDANSTQEVIVVIIIIIHSCSFDSCLYEWHKQLRCGNAVKSLKTYEFDSKGFKNKPCGLHVRQTYMENQLNYLDKLL